MTDIEKLVEEIIPCNLADDHGAICTLDEHLKQKILQHVQELEAEKEEVHTTHWKLIKERNELKAELAEAEAIKLKYGIALEWQCNFYCTWYDTGKPKMDGAAVAYELICEARKALIKTVSKANVKTCGNESDCTKTGGNENGQTKH